MSNVNNTLEKEIQYWSTLIRNHKESNNAPKKRTNDSQYRWEMPATSNKRVKLTSPHRHVRKFVKFTTKTPPSPTVMARKTGVLFSSRYKWSKDPEQDSTDSAQDTSATVNVKSSRKLDRRKEAGSRTSTTKEPSVLITTNKATNLSHSNRQREFTACNKNYKNDSGKVFQKWSLKQRTRNRPNHSSVTYIKDSNPYKLNRTTGGKTEQSINRTNLVRLKSTRVIDRRLRSHKQVQNTQTKKASSGLTPNRHHVTVKQALANRAVMKSHQTAFSKRNKKKAGEQHHCIYFGRFGKCIRGDDCKFIHDPSRIAVCTRFLRGTCRDANCSFSHKIVKEKTPLCIYFLRGKCSLGNCPYLHVYLGKNAPVCRTFATTGYCSEADKCKMQHIKCCPDYYESDQCPDESKCKLPHMRRRSVLSNKAKKNTMDDEMSHTRKTVTQNLTIENKPSVSRSSSTPDFLSLEVSSPITVNRPFTGTSMHIKPRIRKLNSEK